MIVAKIANSHNDEYYTPMYAITPLLKYLPLPFIPFAPIKIWCPFDTIQSNYVKFFEKHGFDVIATHISNGQDFFHMDMPDCDYIISNPPYSKKTEVLKRLFELKKPFAMLVGVVGLFESKSRFDIFRNNDFEIMYFNKRVHYFNNFTDPKPQVKPPFSSVYICHNLLPKQIVFEEINKKDC